ncbi:regulator of protease activity HflC (stomatin/prohibitin superfamily) [Stackebrandtia albiflava]|uniref:Regulator of protease activity HflC (Stomatin/prohibitin superfamily) n=1 Tax=Stackebrandtia albiflava TaxID=406432 RepID=A0A562V3H4_9ACTN|nr:SPFH domain-containing protein [Stackebrandtia albiflava]TWJ12449.1 regulator of protease activity HflC (stomatin/prohibitin superfamily) [Stackebrandtia albiflava]
MNRRAPRISGFVVLLVLVVWLVAAFLLFINLDGTARNIVLASGVAGGVLLILPFTGMMVINPNEAKVVQFFGRYVGTVDSPGFWCTWPLTASQTVSLRVRNFETAEAKVNDADGNPVEIAAVIVWRVVDSAQAVFSVDSYQSYVAIQSESALRHMATCYPYDSHDTDRMSLRDGAQVAEELTQELRERVNTAGIEIVETRITHLAYAPEIAQAMLRRQQANAVVAARLKIVEGAVGMVQLALDQLAAADVVHLDEERKAAMVSNLLVVLCSDQSTQPVVNTGSLYN